MTHRPFFSISKSPVPGTYQILNVCSINSAHVVVRQDESITVIAKIYGGSITYEGAEAIDLLSAMGVKVPPWHDGNVRIRKARD